MEPEPRHDATANSAQSPARTEAVSRRPRRRAWRFVGIIIAVLLVFRVAVVFTSFRGPAEGLPSVENRPQQGEYRDYKGAVHTHSHWSHDSAGSFAQIAEAARRVGLDFVVVTDHVSPQSVDGGIAEAQALSATQKTPLFIVGSEIGPMSGGILAFPLKSSVREQPGGIPQTVEVARQQGAAVFVDHAERFTLWGAASLDGIEIYNLHANFKDASKFPLALRGIFLPPGPMLRGTVSVPEKNLRRWNEMLAKQRAPALGSCDAHSQWWSRVMLGGPVGVYERIFKVVTTHVLVKQLDEASVVNALRRGRSYVVMDIWRDGTGFSFTATDGSQTWQMGDEVPWNGKPIKLTTSSPVMGLLRVLKDGVAITTDDGCSGPAMIDATGPGVYRVEVSLNGKLWILSNPIYVK